jgi:hypothetical protein
MTRPRSRSISQNQSRVSFTKKYKRASQTGKRRLSPIKEGKHEDRSSSSSTPKSKSSQKELIMVSRQKSLKRTSLHSSKVNPNKTKKRTSLIKSIQNLFNF